MALVLSTNVNSQDFTKADTLRGSVTPERAWWDLNYYHLKVRVFPETKSLSGSNIIQYEVLKPANIIQIDLQAPLMIETVKQDGQELDFDSEGSAHFILLQKEQKVGSIEQLEVTYGGVPVEAKNPPWDGGITWVKDEAGNHMIASSCQGIGASVWWPCRDHPADEVDSMMISVEVPDNLMDVSNGRLLSVEENKEKGTKTYNWFVSEPINAYGVNINIGKYATWSEKYKGEAGKLDVTYWPLEVNKKKAKKHFEEVPLMLDAFEHWFGPYPFYDDGYQLVETNYLGMEHQSSITYGNGYVKGYRGRDLSETGWGLKFDYIIIHESGHEWFANNITYKDAADMWVHESFTTYSEALFVDYHHGKEAGQEYVRGLRHGIGNSGPMIGTYGVNKRGKDIYGKGANILNMIRQIIDDDEKWREILRGLNSEFYHQTVTTAEIENYISNNAVINLKPLFDVYLRTATIPTFEYFFVEGQLAFRWTGVGPDFEMPVDIMTGDQSTRLVPTSKWQVIPMEETALAVDPDYYVATFNSK